MTKINWDTVYWKHVPRLYSFFRYRTGDSETAQDLTSRTMTKAWRYRHRYNSDLGAFEAWLFQIGRNIATDYLKQHANAPLPLYEAQDHASAFSVEQEVQKKLDAGKLYRLLQDLPIRDQEIIALKYGADMSNRTIATVLELSESNVGTILHRTIQKLRTQWELTYERA